jgi:hypothetical protein
MTFTLALLVLLAPDDAALASSIATTTRATLGPDALLELRFVDPPQDETAVIAVAQAAHARNVAVITTDAGARHARIRLYDAVSGGHVEREIEFAADDPLEERGRALGFTLASMLPDMLPQAASTAPDTQDVAQGSPANPGPVAPPAAVTPAAPPAPVPPPPPWTFAIDAAARAVAAIDGEGTGFGGELGGQYRLGDHLALRAGAAVHLGHIEPLEARMTIVDIGPGIVWRSHDAEPGQRFALALRADVFARLQSVSRPAARPHAAETHGRFVPGLALGLEASYAISRGFAMFAGGGAQVLLGETEIVLRGREITSFAPVGLGFELGGRAFF